MKMKKRLFFLFSGMKMKKRLFFLFSGMNNVNDENEKTPLFIQFLARTI
jgi:hypothetical protein